MKFRGPKLRFLDKPSGKAEREQFRSLSAAKVHKIIQKNAFGEDINTISTQIFCFLSREALY
jgi:hypothetical protein